MMTAAFIVLSLPWLLPKILPRILCKGMLLQLKHNKNMGLVLTVESLVGEWDSWLLLGSHAEELNALLLLKASWVELRDRVS